MKLIVRQYLASLKERDELDAILPDILTELGLTVLSRPGRGTKQDGVDIAAYGSLKGEEEKVYLFSVKSGDLTRSEWVGASEQSLRWSLDQIIDVYIRTKIPEEYKDKKIVICLTFGGDIKEQVRSDVVGYIARNSDDKISFEEWNGDRLADYVLRTFLREELFFDKSRSLLRKSIALLDEPESSFKFFKSLISEVLKQKDKLKVLRQLNICLWILYSWGRDVGNIEAPYLAAELVLMKSWELSKDSLGKKGKTANYIFEAHKSIFLTYSKINVEFIAFKTYPLVEHQHALSYAVESSNQLDINLKLFDLLGRMGIYGLWLLWTLDHANDEDDSTKEQIMEEIKTHEKNILMMIENNPLLFSPYKDDHAIDISLVLLFLMGVGVEWEKLYRWLDGITFFSIFNFQTNQQYPSVLRSYAQLLNHPQAGDYYKKDVTSGSILYPYISLISAICGYEEIYKNIADFKKEHLQHCNFQFWYPDEKTEELLLSEDNYHGAVLSNVPIEKGQKEFLKIVFEECQQTDFFKNLTPWKYSRWPLILIACRHNRIPVPLHFFAEFYQEFLKANNDQ